ncbi:MAG: SpoIVB peptidase [Lachnospiraceae bacterium]|nr:SpoIVB peptidase [Lachnospiraceae bacterium]
MEDGLLIYRRFLTGILWIMIMLFLTTGYLNFRDRIPARIYLNEQSERELRFDMPVTVMTALSHDVVNKETKNTKLTSQVRLRAGAEDTYHMQVRLLGMIPVREIDVTVLQNRQVYPVGIPVGIYLHTRGVLVLGCSKLQGADSRTYSPAEHILKKGDYIERIDDLCVDDKEELIRMVRNSAGKELKLRIRRQEEEFDVKVVPKMAKDGNYKIGVWVCDSAQGIGTLSYIDEKGKFAALGHGISNVDADAVLKLGYGALYDADIISIKRGQKADPGELTGLIVLQDSELMGEIHSNTDTGIFGALTEESRLWSCLERPVPVGYKEEIVPGAVKILCRIGEEPCYYDARIVSVDYHAGDSHKDMELEITDAELLKLTGGIVQGMSGSPILQNGKIIGVVTHVLVNDPARGYGIFIENML